MSKPQAPVKQPIATTIRLVPEVAEKVREAAETTGLPQSQVTRLALERGLKVLLAQLQSEPAA